MDDNTSSHHNKSISLDDFESDDNIPEDTKVIMLTNGNSVTMTKSL